MKNKRIKKKDKLLYSFVSFLLSQKNLKYKKIKKQQQQKQS